MLPFLNEKQKLALVIKLKNNIGALEDKMSYHMRTNVLHGMSQEDIISYRDFYNEHGFITNRVVDVQEWEKEEIHKAFGDETPLIQVQRESLVSLDALNIMQANWLRQSEVKKLNEERKDDQLPKSDLVEEKKELPQIKFEKIEPIVLGFSEAHAYGSLLGALIGDSCGAYGQFNEEKLTEVEMEFAMSMPGGGPHYLNPGQVSDDGELVLCLMHALAEMQPAETLDIDCIVSWFKKWAISDPFDRECNIEATLMLLKDESATTATVKEAAKA